SLCAQADGNAAWFCHDRSTDYADYTDKETQSATKRHKSHKTNPATLLSLLFLAISYLCNLRNLWIESYGCVISSGLTHSSNCSPVNNPSSIADSRRLIFFWCAFLAIFPALS